MRTIELKVYKFNELSDEAKAKVLERHRDWNVCDSWWYESTVDDWKEKLEKFGFEDAKIYFSGFYSQGDGACFDAKINSAAFAKAHGYTEAEIKAIETLEPHYNIVNINSHYSHAHTRDVQFTGDFYNGASDECLKVTETPQSELPLLMGTLEKEDAISLLETRIQSGSDIRPDLFTSLETHMEEVRTRLSNEIYSDLEKDYDYQTSDEVIIESLEANDREFDEDGDDL